MDVPRRGTSAETVALPLVILPPTPSILEGKVQEPSIFATAYWGEYDYLKKRKKGTDPFFCFRKKGTDPFFRSGVSYFLFSELFVRHICEF